jgi:hypothetical protein
LSEYLNSEKPLGMRVLIAPTILSLPLWKFTNLTQITSTFLAVVEDVMCWAAQAVFGDIKELEKSGTND